MFSNVCCVVVVVAGVAGVSAILIIFFIFHIKSIFFGVFVVVPSIVWFALSIFEFPISLTIH